MKCVERFAFYNCDKLANEDGLVIVGSFLINSYKTSGQVTIPQGITCINHMAFMQSHMTNVVLPDSVTDIADSAFWSCESLQEAVLPQSVVRIGKDAFGWCKSLKKLVLPEGITRIEEDTFQYCSALTEVVIPKSVTYIGPGAFYDCEKLTKVVLRPTECEIDTYAFEETAQVRVSDISALPPRCRPGAAVAFAEDGGDPTDAGFESHIKYIKANAAKLLEQAVEHPALLELMCREKLLTAKHMEKYMAAVQALGDPVQIAMLLDYQENKLTKKQRTAAAKKKEQEENTVLDRAVARAAKVGIDGLNFVMTGSLKTFENRAALKVFIESKGGKLLSSISPKADYLIQNFTIDETEKEKKAKELGIEKIDEYRFNELAGRVFEIDENGVLTRYLGTGKNTLIPEGVTRIGITAFCDCERLESVTIPNTVREIDSFGFSDCHSLHTITIPDSITEIGESAFNNCRSLTQVRIPGTVSVIREDLFNSCSKLQSVILEDGVTEIENGIFTWCSGLKELHIPGSVTKIDEYLFFGVWDIAEKLTIYAPAGSYAETYAKKHGFAFIAE